MAQPDRPLRADAARNRARVLEVAYDTFAAEGFRCRSTRSPGGPVWGRDRLPALPDERGSVPSGREDRIGSIVDEGRDLSAATIPAELFVFLRTVVLQWGAADRGLADSLAGVGIDIKIRDARRRRGLSPPAR